MTSVPQRARAGPSVEEPRPPSHRTPRQPRRPPPARACQVHERVRTQPERGLPVPRHGRVPITRAPSSRASCTAIDPTPPAAPWIKTVWPVLSCAWSNRPCQRSARRWAQLRPRCGRCPPGAGRGCGPPPRCTRPATRREPVGQPEHPLAHGQAGGAVAQLGDNPRQLMPGHARGWTWQARSVHVPGQSSSVRNERGRVDAHDHVIFGHVGVRDVGQREPQQHGGTLSCGDGLHNGSLLRRVQVPTRPCIDTLLVRPRPTPPDALYVQPGHPEQDQLAHRREVTELEGARPAETSGQYSEGPGTARCQASAGGRIVAKVSPGHRLSAMISGLGLPRFDGQG